MARVAVTPHARILLPALALVLWVYRDTFASVVETWHTNSTFSHGYLIVPISLWLAWRERGALAQTVARPSWLGVIALLGCVAAWIVGRGVGVLGVEQSAAMAMIPALVLAICGRQVVRVLAMPLAYLVFAVPIGHALVPWLMHATADVATWVLKLTFVPVHRSDMYIQIPGGKFEVARACSGLNYVVTGLALGALYSYLTYAGWRKRLLSMLAFVAIPILANGMRVYFTILISYLTDMRFGPGAEHVWFGRFFFILVMVVMFWAGRRWADDVPPPTAVATSVSPRSAPLAGWPALAVTFAAVLAGPPYVAAAATDVERQFERGEQDVVLPPAAAGWSGPAAAAQAWKPLYEGARIERSGRYADAQGAVVDAYVAVYGLGTSAGAEMISYRNRIYDEEHRSLGRSHGRSARLPTGGRVPVQDLQVDDDRGRYRVWYWFMVGERPMTSPYQVKAQEGLAFLARHAVTERIVVLATPVGPGDEQRLAAFVAAHAACVRSGFDAGCLR